MLLDLRGIIELPGAGITFDFEPDMTDTASGCITKIEKSHAVGKVKNNAGIIILTCTLQVAGKCECARCLKELDYNITQEIKAEITESGDGENPDGYTINGNEIDIAEIIKTEYLLSSDNRVLCKDDCAGLCRSCGADLNNGKCGCKKETDPRLAKLAQLLEK